MCQKCVDTMKKYYPGIAGKEYGNFLISMTCFPFGDHEMVKHQLNLHAMAKEEGKLACLRCELFYTKDEFGLDELYCQNCSPIYKGSEPDEFEFNLGGSGSRNP